jgi:putative toxin-antitoxin system antitoxin component (TIGR02293 family)
MAEPAISADSSFKHLDTLVREGVPAARVRELIDDGKVSQSIVYRLVIPARTLSHRLRRRENLTTQEADALVRYLRIQALAQRVFSNQDKAALWLTLPSRLLDDAAPLDLLDTESGGRRVEDALHRIDHGQLA